jgi:hypothetical protein
MLKIQSICTIIAKSLLLIVIKQVDKSEYLLDASFRSLSSSRVEKHQNRYLIFNIEGFTILNN